MVGGAGRLDGVARHHPAVAAAHGLQTARLEGHAVHGEEILMAASAVAYAAAVDEQFHVVAGRDHVDRLHRARFVVPVSNDVGAVVLGRHPSVPHHLVGEERVLGNAHGVCNARRAVVGLASEVSVRVRKHNLRPAAVHAPARARPVHEVVVPAFHHAAGQPVLVVVVVGRGRATVERPCALAVEGVAVVVPILAKPLVTVVFHLPIGLAFTLVDVEHFAAILGLVHVEHLAAADGPSAVWVVAVA